ncbi:MAG TPA: alpha/beta hydrolase [Nocardioidaceae bacterium]|nr:alpha/beta hydrolase [Nocardioidaceae bacterium]
MTTFALVHGAWHGAWCWERLVPELVARGHTCIVMDLPIDDASATFDDYADVVVDACTDASSDLVVVGHSLGGMVVPLVAARRAVALGVFLCGVVPNLQGMPWDDAPPMGDDDYGNERDADGTMHFTALEAATAIFYADCTPADAAWAFARLRPVRNASLWDRPYPLSEWPSSRFAAITCTEDRAIHAGFQRHCVRERLGVVPVELPGHHSPFLADPARLASTLDALGSCG